MRLIHESFCIVDSARHGNICDAIRVGSSVNREHNHRTAMTYTSGKWNLKYVQLRALLIAGFALGSSIFPIAARANATGPMKGRLVLTTCRFVTMKPLQETLARLSEGADCK